MKRARLAGGLGGAALLLLLIAGAAWALVVVELDRPCGASETILFTVPKGAALRPTLARLEREGLRVRPRLLYAYARLTGATVVRAGEYEVSPTVTPRALLKMLGEGRVKLWSLSIPEGLNRWQVRDRLVAERWITAADFDRLCDDVDFLRTHGVPGPSCDGYLFPETYHAARGISARELLGTFFERFRKVFSAVIADAGRGPLDLPTRELVTLASIVEKETGAVSERPHIACVFYNRLVAKPRWKLQTDPTVIYAAMLANPRFNGNLTRQHLRELDSPYNTYRIYGLPPGPIANPGRAALEAVTKPVQCEEFFFVSKNNGHHEFCVTLDCHNRAVQKWQVDYHRK